MCVFIPAKFGAVTKNPKLKAQVLEQPGSHLSEGKFVAMVIVSLLVALNVANDVPTLTVPV